MIAADQTSGWALKAKQLTRRSSPGEGATAFGPGVEVRQGVEDFLREHSDLCPFLAETCNKLREYFGPDAAFALKLFQEPEAYTAPVELFLLVKTPLEVEEARERLGGFEEEWWYDNMQRGGFLLHVALEFV